MADASRCRADRTPVQNRLASPYLYFIANSHHNLADFLARTGADPAAQRAHRLAAALLYRLTSSPELTGALRALARELRHDPHSKALPRTPEEVIAVAEQTEGVRLGQFLTTIP